MVVSKKKSKELIEEEIIQFLNITSGKVDPNPDEHSCGTIHNTCLVLATSSKDVPRATPLEFYNEGLNIYIFGQPGGKILNIKRNKKVAAAIYEQPMVHTKVQKNLQIFGEAELITLKSNPQLFREKANKWGQYKVVEKLMSPILKRQKVTGNDAEEMVKRATEATFLIKIIPNHIILREWHEDFNILKYVWKANKN